MCICINCIHIQACNKILIKSNENKNVKIKKEYCFNPISPVIDVKLYNHAKLIKIEWDLVECLSFVELPGQWLKTRQLKS
uniref:hypothetical protein n=1 Tax=Erythrolobus coxiae TaxID=362235 RepID=UPI001FCD82E5|nr:hypothetical protein MW556_pgp153 [Erythrolobus coxiae]UNJ17654.1 hypothetical protein [Erythrolobus coxiae]